MSHGFLMVQSEVSLLPLCVGRSRQAGGGGSARTAPATREASSWAGSKVVQGQTPHLGGRGQNPPLRGRGARRLHGGHAYVWTQRHWQAGEGTINLHP